jgi:lipopolysaccharide/colanic/teichoic acid biosynthesis glycosyltransferase
MTRLNTDRNAATPSLAPASDCYEPYRGKRTLDLLAASTGCALFAPLVVIISVATLFEDGGPVLFFQTRLGRRRADFEIIKFRSMRHHRVTRIGQWLRRTGLDELPQFVNVLRGDMSVVGPRPLTSHDLQRLGWTDARLDWRFAAKPGITGLSQLLAGRGARHSRRLDRLYLQRQSAWVDAKLLALSFAVNVVGKGRIRRMLRGVSD